MAEEEALTPEEEAFIATEIEPYIRLKYPPEYQARVRDAVRKAVAKAKRKQAKRFGGMAPPRGQLGIRVGIKPLDFNLTSWRTSLSAGWQDRITDFDTSKLAHIVICKYVDYETVKRVVELQWQIAGEKYPVLDLAELKVNPKGEFYIDPMILNPATRIDALSYNVEVAGYTSLQPDGFVVATKDYLMSRTYMAGS